MAHPGRRVNFRPRARLMPAAWQRTCRALLQEAALLSQSVWDVSGAHRRRSSRDRVEAPAWRQSVSPSARVPQNGRAKPAASSAACSDAANPRPCIRTHLCAERRPTRVPSKTSSDPRSGLEAARRPTERTLHIRPRAHTSVARDPAPRAAGWALVAAAGERLDHLAAPEALRRARCCLTAPLLARAPGGSPRVGDVRGSPGP